MLPRVRMRSPRLNDQQAFLELIRKSRALHHPWIQPANTPAAFRKYVLRNEEHSFEAMLLVRRADQALMGAFNLSQIFHGPFKNAYLGYWVGQPFAGQGYMAEGMHLLLRHAFRKLKLHRVEANVQPGNKDSIALLRGAGFRREGYSPRYLKIAGRWRDHERWAITVEDFRSPAAASL